MTNFVAGSWKSEFVYDGLMRRRIERDYSWNGSSWFQTNEIHFVYDGNDIIQHRDSNNVPTLTFTRGKDLSGTLQGAGGIGGLLAMTEEAGTNSYYHADGNATDHIAAGQWFARREQQWPTYFPNAGFTGSDMFTYTAWDTSKNSALATGMVSVVQGPYSLDVVSHVATNAPSGWPVAFAAVPTVTNNSSAVTFNWNFGDASGSNTNQFAQHIFSAPGNCSWQVVAAVGTASATNSGGIVINAPVVLAMSVPQNYSLSLAWPSALPDVVVEQSTTLGSGARWTVVTNLPVTGPVNSGVNLPVTGGNRFFRLRQPW